MKKIFLLKMASQNFRPDGFLLRLYHLHLDYLTFPENSNVWTGNVKPNELHAVFAASWVAVKALPVLRVVATKYGV